MSTDNFSIGYDSEFQSDEWVATDIEGVDYVRDIPCESCEFSKECEIKALDCVATRNWYYNGDYLDADVSRLRRACK